MGGVAEAVVAGAGVGGRGWSGGSGLGPAIVSVIC